MNTTLREKLWLKKSEYTRSLIIDTLLHDGVDTFKLIDIVEGREVFTQSWEKLNSNTTLETYETFDEVCRALKTVLECLSNTKEKCLDYIIYLSGKEGCCAFSFTIDVIIKHFDTLMKLSGFTVTTEDFIITTKGAEIPLGIFKTEYGFELVRAKELNS